MERPFTGLTAELKVNDVVLGYASGFDLTLEKTIIEILQFGARYQEKVPAIKDWSASIDGTLALAPGGSQEKLYTAFENDEEITFGIFLSDFVYFEGKGYVSSFNISGAPDDKISLTSDVAGNGGLLLTLPHTYSVTANSGVGGTCVPGGTTQVVAQGSLAITITPAPNYEVDTVLDNGEDVTSSVQGNVYTVQNVEIDHKVSVSFKTFGGADKSKLRAAILYAESLTASDYTSTSYATLATQLTNAKTVNGNVRADQETVDSANAELNTAIQGLVKAE